ncbi:hypothetical protein RSAG8_00674, partial [Rhizoctonia solani AG-8 WAC10335]
MKPFYAPLSEPPPYQSADSPIRSSKRDRLLDGAIITWSLALHFVGSLAIAATFIFWLDERHFNIEREQPVPIVDGTSISLNTEWYRAPLHVQPDVTTAISALLRVLALIGDAWAASLCWRVIMLLAETSRDGINRCEIEWIVNYGALPLMSHFRLSLNPVLGIILLVTLARNVASPILNTAWVPSSSILKLPHWPTIPISGVNVSSGASFDEVNTAAIPINLASILNTAWGTDVEDYVYKRVVPSAGALNTGSTIQNVTMPYFSITNITWLPNDVPTNLTSQFKSMIGDISTFPHLDAQMSQSGAIALLSNTTWRDNGTHGIQGTWSLLLNVVGSYREYRKNGSCDLNRTVLVNNTQVPFQNGNGTWDAPGCFALANVSFIAGSGVCEGCRVASNFTVQNTTELAMLGDSYISVERALADMPVHVPSLAPLLGSFPDPTKGINDYVNALLLRSYSALWNAWTDAADPMSESRPSTSQSSSAQSRVAVSVTMTRAQAGAVARLARSLILPRSASQATRDPTTLQSEYQPAFPTLQARIDKTRVYVWLGIQLLLTFAGLAFLCLQVGSCASRITDTGMLAFDIDSREVPKPERKKLKGIFKGIFESVVKVFLNNKDTPEQHESEVVLKAIYNSEQDVWKVVRAQTPKDEAKLADLN